uniref:uncharacterized protein LOC122603750 isoform X2 n=1 Tax=Erigeron canadensis TaxID=72917 RepID=UPI001CB9362E|nr:uncharacterized protein LOC122603750 isoform X2 [Erigeron canadensis]
MRRKGRYLQGEFPTSGAIFMCNTRTKKECLRRRLFGLPSGDCDFVLHVKRGMILFLFEYERRLLYGVYRATSDGEINIEPRAFRSSGKYFPAQDAIKDNYFSEKKFRFGLNKDQVSKLMKLFHYKKTSKNHPEKHRDKPTERVSRFGNLKKNIRDRLSFVDKVDSRDLRISEFSDNEVEVDDDDDDDDDVIDVYVTKKMVEGSQKVDRDRFLTNYVAQNVDSGDCGTRQDTLGKCLDHSLGGLRRVTDVNLDFMGDVMDGHDKRYKFEELRGLTNKDSFSMMDNIKSEHDVEDRYIPTFTRPREKHYGEIDVAHNDAKILVDAKDRDILYYNRLQDEYNVRESYRRSLSASHLGSPCVIGSQTIADRYFLGHEAVGSNVDNAIPFSHNNQNTYLTSCETRTGIPEVQLNSFYLADESNFIPLDNGPFYPSSTDAPTFLPLGKSPPRHPHNEEPMQYFDDLSYASLDKRQMTAEGNRVYETAPRDGSHSPLFPDFVSKRLSSSNAGPCKLEESTIDNVKMSHQPCKSKYLFGTDKRVSVFARLNSSLKHGKEEHKTNKKHDLDASVDQVMEMLEKVVSSPTRKDGKSKSALKKDDNDKRKLCKIAGYEFQEVVMELDADQAHEETEGRSELRETRILDFKRRKKTNKCIDDASKEKSECLVGAASDVGPMENNNLVGVRCKRRKLVRSAFVEKKSTNDISTTNDADILKPLNSESISTKGVLEDTLSNNDCDSIKAAALESLQKVDTSVNINMMPDTHVVAPSKEDSSLTEAVLEGTEKVDAFTESAEESSMLSIPLVTTLFKDDCDATEAVLESTEKVDAFTESVEEISMLSIPLETTLSKDDCDATETVLESTEKVDAFTESVEEISMLSIPLETTLSKDDCDAKEGVIESSDKVDASIKSAQLSAECQRGVNKEGPRDGNAYKFEVADVFVKIAPVASLEDRDNMCGWIEW